MMEGAEGASPKAETAGSAVAVRRSLRPRRSKVGPRSRQRFPVEAWRFRDARLSVGLGVDRCADLLRVSPRTVRTWEAGTSRVPYAAYKLMRILRGGKLLGDDWRGFHVWRDTLITPEGHKFEASQLAWWSLQVRMAREWQRGLADRRVASDHSQPASLAVDPEAALESERFGVREANPNSTASEAASGSPGRLQDSQAPASFDRLPAALVASVGRECVTKNRLPGPPTSNRGVSEPERLGFQSPEINGLRGLPSQEVRLLRDSARPEPEYAVAEAVTPPQAPRAATLPKAGVAARPSRAGVTA